MPSLTAHVKKYRETANAWRSHRTGILKIWIPGLALLKISYVILDTSCLVHCYSQVKFLKYLKVSRLNPKGPMILTWKVLCIYNITYIYIF